jgi:uncharacterized protein
MHMKKSYPTYWQAVGLLLMQIPIGLVLVLLAVPFTNIQNMNVAVSTLLGSAIVMGVVIFGLWLRKDNTFSYALFPVSMLIATFVLIMSFNVVIDPLVSLIPTPDFLTETFSGLVNYPVVLFFSIALAAPVLEEILFRGIILDGFLKNYTPFKSILVSALLFGIIHMNFQQGIGAVFMGIVVGFLYWRTRSILFCIAVHGLNNLFASVSMLFMTEEEMSMSFQEYLGNDSQYYSVYAGCIILSIGCGWFLWTRYVKDAQALIHVEPAKESVKELLPEEPIA